VWGGLSFSFCFGADFVFRPAFVSAERIEAGAEERAEITMSINTDTNTGTADPCASGLVIGDGAMGSELLRLGMRAATTLHANGDEAGLVRRVHREYVEAGARWIQTNTFLAPHLLAAAVAAAPAGGLAGGSDDGADGANDGATGGGSDGGNVLELARAGVRHAVDIVNEVAREGPPAVVLSLGPVAPDTTSHAQAAAYQALGALASRRSAVAAIMLETFLDESALLATAAAVLEGGQEQPVARREAAAAAAPPRLLLSLTPSDVAPGSCWSAAALDQLSRQPFAGRVAAVGLNCGPGWDAAAWIALADDLHARLPPSLPLLLKPSRPRGDNSPAADSLTPLLEHLRALSRHRRVLLFGCCGLGPPAIHRWCRQPTDSARP
jgi:methionine synthase I (cobalamin-dependent)